MFHFAGARRARRPSLTPMIDVVFLLLIFFMLVAQVGRDRAQPLTIGAGGDAYRGPPRLVTIGPAVVALNGVPMRLDALGEALQPLTEGPEDAIVLRGVDGADLQRLTDVAAALSAAGHRRLVVVE